MQARQFQELKLMLGCKGTKRTAPVWVSLKRIIESKVIVPVCHPNDGVKGGERAFCAYSDWDIDLPQFRIRLMWLFGWGVVPFVNAKCVLERRPVICGI